MDLQTLALVFAMAAGVIYLSISARYGRQPELKEALESIVSGFAVPGGLFLMLCAFMPHLLFKIHNQAGQDITSTSIVTLDSDSRLCILSGGFVVTFLAFSALASSYKQTVARGRLAGVKPTSSGASGEPAATPEPIPPSQKTSQSASPITKDSG